MGLPVLPTTQTPGSRQGAGGPCSSLVSAGTISVAENMNSSAKDVEVVDDDGYAGPTDDAVHLITCTPEGKAGRWAGP